MKSNKMSLLAIGGAALLVGCGLTSPSLPANEPAVLPVTLKQAYAEKAITGVSMLASTNFLQATPAVQGPLLRDGQNQTPVTEEDLIAKFTEYLTLMDSFLTPEGNPFQYTELVSDRPEYTYRLSITVSDLLGSPMAYEMYFNVKDDVITEEPSSSETSSEPETSTPESSIDGSDVTSSETSASSEVLSSTSSSTETSSEVTTDPLARRGDDHDDEDEDDEDDIDTEDEEDDRDRDEYDQYDDEPLRDRHEENSYQDFQDRDLDDDEVLLEGIVIFEGETYSLLGIEEIDEDETETKFFISLDEQNWIKIKREVEADEQKYDLAMKKAGEFSKLSFKVEMDDDGEVEVKLKTLINGELVAYHFEKEMEDGLEVIKIKILENNQMLHVRAVPGVDEEGNPIYTFYVHESGKGYEGRPHGDHHNHPGR